MKYSTVERPTLLLDEFRCRMNIRRMVKKARKKKKHFSPHFKTHQSIEIGEWFREEGVHSITVSSAGMAAYFASAGWRDITIAFPFFPSMIPALQYLEKSVDLRLFIHNPDHIQLLNQQLVNPFRVVVELDPGYGRSGIHYSKSELLESIVNCCSETAKAQFVGFYIHDGRTYQDAVSAVDRGKEVLGILSSCKSLYPEASVIFGDTPSASLLTDFGMADEITPGNFVFYDWMQVQIGSCSLDDVALFCQLPVAQIRREMDQVIVHGGAVHLSKDFLREGDRISYGQVVDVSDTSVTLRDGFYLLSLSQEHGVLRIPAGAALSESVTLCPVHSCLTANLYDHYITTKGNRIEKRILS